MTAASSDWAIVRSSDEVAEQLLAAIRDGVTVTAARNAGESVRRIDLTQMNAVVDYPARDMTITVQAGMAMEALADVLKSEDQQLPVDVADPDTTVGAFVASDLGGPRQYGYGTLRDYLIGLEAVDGQGRIFHAGGRVVKNVAGYDLCRLMVGSCGALGILCELTFKLRPIAEHAVVRSFAFGDRSGAAAALDALNVSSARPVLINLELSDSAEWTICVGVEGTEDLCGWQLQQLERELSTARRTVDRAMGAAGVTQYCSELAVRHLPDDHRLRVRTLPSRVVDVCAVLAEYRLSWAAHAGSGVIAGTFADGSSNQGAVVSRLESWISDCGGSISVGCQPPTFRDHPNSLAARLIAAFDPHGVFGET